jgi:hypothetical protein
LHKHERINAVTIDTAGVVDINSLASQVKNIVSM